MHKCIRTLIVFALLFFCARAAHAQTRTFYIDYASGSNSFDGTEKVHTTGITGPWQTHPYMRCGTAPMWTHNVGDQFIFKGGVSWPSSCFQMGIAAGGASGNSDYYGVDQTWFTGASWTRPKFAADSLKLAGGFNVIRSSCASFSDFSSPSSGCNYVTFDNIEIGPWDVVPGANTSGNNTSGPAIVFGGAIPSVAATGVVVKNGYIHDWFSSTNITGTAGCNPSTNCSGLFGYGVIYGVSLVTNTTISDAAGHYVFNGATVTDYIMGGVAGSGEVANSTIHDGVMGVSSDTSIHDTEFYHIQGGVTLGYHSHVIYEDALGFQTMKYVYNNYVHDNNPGIVVNAFYETAIFNNVFWNNSQSTIAIACSMVSSVTCASAGDTSGAVGYVVNNTIDDSTNPGTAANPCYRWGSGGSTTTGAGTLNFYNNICIPGSSGVGGFSVATINGSSTDYTMGTSEASAFGFTSARKYAPTSSDSNVVGRGANLASFYTGVLTPMGLDTEGAPWYGAFYVTRTTTPTLGAYQWPLSGVGNAVDSFAPTSLTFSTQTTGTSSSPQTVTLTNTGSATDAISGISVTGTNASQFTDTTDCPSALTAGSSCHISVTFSPTIAGSLVASVSITDTVNPSGAAVISLSGTGQAPGLFTLAQTAPDTESVSAATCVVTFPANPANGSSVMVAAVPGSRTGDTLTAVDANSNSYTLSTHSPSTPLSGAGQVFAFHLDSASGASKTITITDTSATPSFFDCGGVNFQVVSGYTPSFDADAVGVSASGTPVAVPSFTPNTSQEALFMMGTPGNYFSAVGAPWTSVSIFVPNAGSPHWGTSTGYIVNQTGAVNPNLTSVSPGGGSAIIEAFKATATGSTPTISSLSAISGNEGASVTITGTNFGASQGTSTVQINGTAITCASWSATSLGCTIPTPSSTGGISVTTTAGASNSVTFTVTPHLASLSVTSGPVGTSTVLTGTGFGATQGISTVTFNGVTAMASAWSDTSITTTAPAGSTTGNVIVTQGGNASNGVSFTVNPHITSLSPTHAVVGAAVTITGTTFGASQGASTVKFNGTLATCTSWSNLSLSCTVPIGAATGNVVVHNGTDSNGVSFTVDAPVSTPVIASVTPSAGPAGTTLTITGSNFGASQGTSTVTFAGFSAAVTSWSATQIVCVAPVISLGGASTSTGNMLVTVSGNASNPAQFTIYLYSFVVIGTTK